MELYRTEGDSYDTLGNEQLPNFDYKKYDKYRKNAEKENPDDYIEPYFFDPSIPINIDKNLYYSEPNIPIPEMNKIINKCKEAQNMQIELPPCDNQENISYWD